MWLRSRARDEVEHLTLPVLQLLAAALNHAVVVLAARPVFDLPLGSSEEVATGRDLLAGMHTTSTPGKRTAETPPEPGADVAPASAVGGGYWSGAG